MAAKGYKQEMPPPGGYADILWAKKTPPNKMGGKLDVTVILQKMLKIYICRSTVHFHLYPPCVHARIRTYAR